MSVAASPVVAIDLGGTKALAGVVEADGAVRSRVWLPSRDLSGRPAELLDRLAEGAAAAATEADLPFEAVGAVGVCVPGPLDRSRSVVAVAPNLGWVDLAVRQELERRLLVVQPRNTRTRRIITGVSGTSHDDGWRDEGTGRLEPTPQHLWVVREVLDPRDADAHTKPRGEQVLDGSPHRGG